MGTALKKSTDLCDLEKWPKIIGGNFSFLLPLRAPMSKIVLGGGLFCIVYGHFSKYATQFGKMAIWKNVLNVSKCVLKISVFCVKTEKSVGGWGRSSKTS